MAERKKDTQTTTQKLKIEQYESTKNWWGAPARYVIPDLHRAY